MPPVRLNKRRSQKCQFPSSRPSYSAQCRDWIIGTEWEKNATFETFPVGKQEWHKKDQMLRWLMLKFMVSKKATKNCEIFTVNLIWFSASIVFYPISKDHLCTVTFGLMYGLYSRTASNQERPLMVRVRYIIFLDRCEKQIILLGKSKIIFIYTFWSNLNIFLSTLIQSLHTTCL